MTRETKIRLALAVLVFMNLQAVLFGFGMLPVLYHPNHAGRLRIFLDTACHSGDLHYFRCRLLVDCPAFAGALLAVRGGTLVHEVGRRRSRRHRLGA